MANEKKPLGIPNTSQSSALGPTRQGPDLASLLEGTTFLRTLAEAQSAEQGMRDVQSQRDPSLIDKLLSPGGLATILATIGAGAATGGAGAAAFGMGALPQLSKAVAQEREERAAAVGALQDQRDEALDRADKSMNRFTQILTSNPEALEDIPPTLLGPLATGEAIRLNPTARRKAARSDAAQKRRHEFLMEALQAVDSTEQARLVVKQIMRNQDWDAPAEVVNQIASAIGTKDVDATMANIGAKHGGASFQSALIAAREKGVDVFMDPETLAMIDWNEKEEESLTPSQQENLKVLGLDEELNRWSADPANQATIETIRAETGRDEIAFQKRVVEIAFSGRSGDVNIYLDARGHLARENKWKAFTTAWAESGGPFALADIMMMADPKFQVMNEEQKLRYRAHTAFTTFKSMLDTVNQTNAFDDAMALHDATHRFLKEIPNMDSGRAQDIAKKAIENATDESGRVVKEIFNQEVQTAIDQFLAQQKGE